MWENSCLDLCETFQVVNVIDVKACKGFKLLVQIQTIQGEAVIVRTFVHFKNIFLEVIRRKDFFLVILAFEYICQQQGDCGHRCPRPLSPLWIHSLLPFWGLPFVSPQSSSIHYGPR